MTKFHPGRFSVNLSQSLVWWSSPQLMALTANPRDELSRRIRMVSFNGVNCLWDANCEVSRKPFWRRGKQCRELLLQLFDCYLELCSTNLPLCITLDRFHNVGHGGHSVADGRKMRPCFLRSLQQHFHRLLAGRSQLRIRWLLSAWFSLRCPLAPHNVILYHSVAIE